MRLRKDGKPDGRVKVKEGQETIEVSPGKFEVVTIPKLKKTDKEKSLAKSGKLKPVVIPLGISPFDYLTAAQRVIIGRIERIAQSGKMEDAVKLKANQTLLNKTLPDITKQEVIYTESPYDRILRVINEEEGKDG